MDLQKQDLAIEQLESRKKKGFTLMEMLIVVAIIAVLVAIAIPIFTAQLNKARAATDEANIRSGYALVSATVLSDGAGTNTTWSLNADGTITEGEGGTYKTQASSTDLGAEPNIAGQNPTWSKGDSITYTYNSTTNVVTIASKSA